MAVKKQLKPIVGEFEESEYLRKLNNGLVGSLLRELRETKGFTQIQLALSAGVGVTTICEIETNTQKMPTALTLFKLSKALGGTAWQDRWANPVTLFMLTHELSRAGMARKCGVSRQAIINIEHGQCSDKTIFKVSKVLGVTPRALKIALGRMGDLH